MSKEKVEVMVEGGKASAGAQMGQAFGPLGVNLQAILQEINKKTEAFKGMKVPAKVIVDTDTKEFEVSIGTPPVSELIKKELNITKGSGTPDKEKLANISIEQLIKIAKMKESSILHNTLKAAVKSVAGSCNSIGMLIEGTGVKTFNQEIDEGKYNKELQEEKTETSPEKLQQLKAQLSETQEEMKEALEKAKAEEEAAKAEEAPAAEEAPKEGEEKPAEGEEAAKAEEKKEEEKK